MVGCDSTLSLGYAYNADNDDDQYGSAPPAVGCALLRGPAVVTGYLSDTALSFGQRLPGYKNLPMTAFAKHINGTDPDNYIQAYRYMTGLQSDGSAYMYNGVPTTFMHSGNPVLLTGDLDPAPGDKRFMISCGPISLMPNDSTELIYAIIVGRGADRLSSVAAPPSPPSNRPTPCRPTW